MLRRQNVYVATAACVW